MFLNVCLLCKHIWSLERLEGTTRFPGAGLSGTSHSLSVDGGNRTQVLWNSRRHSLLLNHHSSPILNTFLFAIILPRRWVLSP